MERFYRKINTQVPHLLSCYPAYDVEVGAEYILEYMLRIDGCEGYGSVSDTFMGILYIYIWRRKCADIELFQYKCM